MVDVTYDDLSFAVCSWIVIAKLTHYLRFPISVIDTDFTDAVCGNVKNTNTELYVYGVGFRDEENEDDDASASPAVDNRTPLQQSNEKLLREFAANCDGEVLALHNLMELLSYFQSKYVSLFLFLFFFLLCVVFVKLLYCCRNETNSC